MKIKADIMKNNYKLSIFGDAYSVVSDESIAQVTQAASMVDSLMNEIASKVSQVDEKRIAVLVALQLASKYLALKSQLEETGLKHRQLINYMDQDCLSQFKEDK